MLQSALRSAGGIIRSSIRRHEQLIKKTRVVVHVPATTANLGAGLDSIGMALNIWNKITVERAERFSLKNEIEGEGRITSAVSCRGESNHMVLRGVRRAFEYAGEMPMPPEQPSYFTVLHAAGL